MLNFINTEKVYNKIINDKCELYWAEDILPQAWCMYAFDVPAGSEKLL